MMSVDSIIKVSLKRIALAKSQQGTGPALCAGSSL